MASHNRRVRGGGGVWMYRWQRLKRAPFVVLDWLHDPKLCLPFAILAVLAECVINLVVIQYVRYTEIDWRAYMDEVEGVYNGTRDYSQLRGGTGPLVYPAGFVYAYLGLYHVTSGGRNMRLAQYIFAAIYLVTVCLVNRLYVRSRRVPPYVLLLMTLTSYRVHSIYVLRLFNDPVAMLLLYASLNCLLDARWSLASLLFSLAVSVKMSVLLFSPALLLAFVICLGVWGTALQLSICAGTQLLLAVPFLLENPVAYLRGSFDLGRVFEHKWTVNWRFVPESVFVDRRFHVVLLVGHLLLVSDFAWRHWLDQLRLLASLPAAKATQTSPSDADKSAADDYGARRCRLLLLPLFTCNLIGVAFSRSLHYQFYVWYYHGLPFLLWSVPLHSNTRLLLLGVIELCWNTFPSTSLSSTALHGCHAILVAALWRTVNSSAQVPIRKAAKTVDSLTKQQ